MSAVRRFSEAHPEQVETDQVSYTDLRRIIMCDTQLTVMIGTSMLSRAPWCPRALWCQFLVGQFLVHSTINAFILDFQLSQAKFHFIYLIQISSKSTGKCTLLLHCGYCQLITEYLVSGMMKCYCLRVSRRDVRRIGKHSQFSVFPSLVHWSSDYELCRVPIRSISG